MRRKVKVVIIGAGSAGLSALSEVQRQTEDFILVNQGAYGTSCARVACMPTKTLIEVSRAYYVRHIMKKMGVAGTDALRLEVPSALAYVKHLRDTFVAGMVKETQALGEQSIAARASFIEPTVLQVGEDIIEAESVVIATGSSPIVPENWWKLGSLVVTTDEFFYLEDLPPEMAVIGLGPSGIELAQALHRLGIKITAFSTSERLGGLTDPEVVAKVEGLMNKEFPLHLKTGVRPFKAGKGLRLQYAGDQEVQVQKVLLAIGRQPNLAGLGLEKLGLESDEHGIPVFNRQTMQIGELPLFIAGDVCGRRRLLHEAVDEGHIAGYNAVRLESNCINRRIPLAIAFAEPEIACVGVSFKELKERDVVIGAYDFSKQSRARMSGKNRGLLRIYLERQDGRLLGAEMAAPDGEHLAHILALAIQEKQTVFDLLNLPFYHPTVEEGLRTALREGRAKVSRKQQELELLFCRSASMEPIS